MANNFRVWDEGGNNIVTQGQFESSSSQVGTGFVSGTPASSSFANSGLREGTLVATALMEAARQNGVNIDDLHFDSAMQSIVTAIRQGFPKLYRHNVLLSVDDANSVTYSVRFSIVSSTATPLITIDDEVTDLDAYNALINIKTLIAGTELDPDAVSGTILDATIGGVSSAPAMGQSDGGKTIFALGFLKVNNDDVMVLRAATSADSGVITLATSGLVVNGMYDNVIAL